MHRFLRRVMPRPALVVLLGVLAGALAPLAMNDADTEHVARAQSALVALRPSLGLQDADTFRVRTSHVNEQGTTILRFTQTHAGYRVWGGEAISHAQPSGTVKTLTQGVQANVTLAGEPRLTAAQAATIAVRELAPKGPMAMPPQVERIVFPSHFTGGVAMAWNSARMRYQLDRAMSVMTRPPTAPYVWAYEVKTVLRNRPDGHRETSFIVDGATGAILRKANELKTAAAVGLGHGLYNPAVPLGTTRHSDGTYSMVDTTRGTHPNPFLSPTCDTSVRDCGSNYAYTGPFTGLVTLYEDHSTFSSWGGYGFGVYQGNKVDTWGNGILYAGSFVGNWQDGVLSLTEETPNGQTPAVDAQYGVATTWDFYKHVFGRNGIDNLGTSTFTYNHQLANGPLDNASWSDAYFGMFYGDGTYPDDPNGFQEMAEMDVTGHEMTHGVTANTAALVYDGESGGLNEATSDIFGEMVEAYSKRASGADAGVIPEGNDFLIGLQVGRGTPLRWMMKPSKDGISEDQWYDGMYLLDVHYTSGPMNRAYYYLSHGASSNSADDSYSPYLPGGMVGIGNDKAGHIYFKALSEYFTANTDYTAAREAVLQAAKDLFPNSSTETDAVMRAFAAINIGDAPGAPPRTRITMPRVHDTGYLSALDAYVLDFTRAPVLPISTTVTLHATVENNANTAVEWKTQGPKSFFYCGGTVNPDGTWTTSGSDWRVRSDLCLMTAVSQADPLQYAVGSMFLINLDADDDLEQDAIDLGASALSWGLSTPISNSHSFLEAGFVSDFDAAVGVEAIRNAFPVRFQPAK
jgi:Zn-dependent metalloprotease